MSFEKIKRFKEPLNKRVKSPVDFIWGIGMALDYADVSDPGNWPGLNLLGFALMEVRDLLR